MDYGNLNEFQRERALHSKMHIDLLTFIGKIDKNLLRGRVLDWGAGNGISTQALKNFGGYVEAVDRSGLVQEIVRSGILPEDRVYCKDGVEFLLERPDTYDLIAGLWCGPFHGESDNYFLRWFYQVACKSLKPRGRIVLTSDSGSFKKIQNLVSQGYGEAVRYPGFLPAFISGKTSFSAFSF